MKLLYPTSSDAARPDHGRPRSRSGRPGRRARRTAVRRGTGSDSGSGGLPRPRALDRRDARRCWWALGYLVDRWLGTRPLFTAGGAGPRAWSRRCSWPWPRCASTCDRRPAPDARVRAWPTGRHGRRTVSPCSPTSPSRTCPTWPAGPSPTALVVGVAALVACRLLRSPAGRAGRLHRPRPGHPQLPDDRQLGGPGRASGVENKRRPLAINTLGRLGIITVVALGLMPSPHELGFGVLGRAGRVPVHPDLQRGPLDGQGRPDDLGRRRRSTPTWSTTTTSGRAARRPSAPGDDAPGRCLTHARIRTCSPAAARHRHHPRRPPQGKSSG